MKMGTPMAWPGIAKKCRLSFKICSNLCGPTKPKQYFADQTESESEVDDDPLGLVQPSDQQDASYRPYQLTTRRKGEGTHYHKSRGRWIEPTCGRLMTLSQSPTEEQESEPKAQSSNKRKRSWVPKAVLSVWDRWNSRPEMDTLSVKL